MEPIQLTKEDIEFMRVMLLLYLFSAIAVGDDAGKSRVEKFAKKLINHGYK